MATLSLVTHPARAASGTVEPYPAAGGDGPVRSGPGRRVAGPYPVTWTVERTTVVPGTSGLVIDVVSVPVPAATPRTLTV